VQGKRTLAFSSQVESLGGSENATKLKRSGFPRNECAGETHFGIFKPSGITWRLGKCDQTKITSVSRARMGAGNALGFGG